MASTYVNDLRLNEMATGDQSGSWGTVTNTNLELIAEAFSYGTEAITTNADTHTTTIADGATDPGRSMFLKYTGTLDSACTITIGPNTVSKLWFIENATSGSQDIIIKQGSGATVTIASGKTKVIYSDGVGSGAKMVDAFAALDVGALSGTTGTFSGAVSGASATFDGGVDIDNINIDGTTIALSSGDLTLDVAGILNLDSAFSSGTTGGIIRLKDAGTQFGDLYEDSGNFLIASAQVDKDIIFKGNDNGSIITALTLDMSASGRATFNNNVVVTDNNSLVAGSGDDLQITYDGTNGEIDVSSGNLTLDVAGDITLDADGGYIWFNDGGTTVGYLKNESTDLAINVHNQDRDIFFKGNDGGSTITALTLDMSNGGQAVFNKGASFQDHVYLQDNDELRLGNSDDLRIYHDGSNSYVQDSGTGQLRIDTNGSDVRITKTDSEYMGKFIADGGVELYHNNSKKFETTSSGVTVTGTVAATSYTGDGSNLTGISAGGMVLLNRSDVANSSQYVFTGFNSSLYDAYIIDFHGIQIASGGSPWVMYFSSNGGSSYMSNVTSVIHKAKHSGTNATLNDSWSNGYAELAGSIGGTGDGVGTCGSGTIKLMNVAVGNDRGFQAHWAAAYINYSTERVVANGAVMANQSGNTSQPDCNAIKMKFYNGTNINKGTISVFGVIKS